MAKLRVFLIAALVLALGSCQFAEQENFITFTWDGVQYLFTASAATESHPWAVDHPYAVGYYWGSNPPYGYLITGSATGQDAQDGTDTIQIELSVSEGYWNVNVVIFDSSNDSTWFYTRIPDGMMNNSITNLDAVGEQLSGTMPGVLYEEQGSSTLSNIIFSVERLPNVEEG
jgi:hypothetical protein